MTFKYLRTGEATKIDEYVPIITPKIIAKEKPLSISPPKIKIENKAKSVVTDVINVLDKVSFTDKFEISSISNLLYLDKIFSYSDHKLQQCRS